MALSGTSSPSSIPTLSPYENFDYKMELTERKIRYEEMMYMRFMVRRHLYASEVPIYEFKRTMNAVSMRLVFYDPNFDFSYPDYLSRSIGKPSYELPRYTTVAWR